MNTQAENLKSRILEFDDFDSLAIEVFQFQAEHNVVYSKYLSLLNTDPSTVNHISQIPFLPVEAFKSNHVKTGEFNPEAIFKSSGTTNSIRSEHHVKSLKWYHEVSVRIYNELVGEMGEANWFGLLPGYSKESSLVDMVKNFMRVSGSNENFHLDDFNAFSQEIQQSQNPVLIGVTHAILSWLDTVDFDLQKVTIIETGGMKGHGREPLRSEVHSRIRDVFPKAQILSEYGMTELLSQAYSLDGKYFESPPWMRILIKDTADPMTQVEAGRTGRVQIVDLANIDSCAFISTSDLGRMEPVEGSNRFEILGRFDHSEVRGCNLLSVN